MSDKEIRDPIRNEYGDIVACEHCSVGAAVINSKSRIEEGKDLCDLCYGASIEYARPMSDAAETERIIARYLNAFRGTVSS